MTTGNPVAVGGLGEFRGRAAYTHFGFSGFETVVAQDIYKCN